MPIFSLIPYGTPSLITQKLLLSESELFNLNLMKLPNNFGVHRN